MKKNNHKIAPVIKLYCMILFAAIMTILFFTPKFSYAQVVPGNFDYEGENRTYLVYLPDNYTGTENFPLLVCLHSYYWSGQEIMEYTNFNQVADTSNFIVLYPDAIPDWNSGIGENPSWPTPNVNDVGFIDALIDTLDYNYSIDLARVYACGFSNGGFMSYRLACELNHRFAAIASIAGVISNTVATNCEPSGPMPVLHIHGTADAVVPYFGGAPGWYSVDETLNLWIDFNNCLEVDTIVLPDIDPTDGCTVELIRYTNCINNSNVYHYKVINGGHTWPGAGPSGLPLGNTNQDINASVEIWNFFKNYPPNQCLPEGITFSTQEEIDNFQINYPYCTEIEGDVEIGTYQGSNIVNLDELYVLQYIGGDLNITYNNLLQDMTGLGNLNSIGGNLLIYGNDTLTSLSGLESLSSIGGSLSIGKSNAGGSNYIGNPSLTNIESLSNLTSIGGSLGIYVNDNLTSLSGLNNITSLDENLTVFGNAALIDLSGLDNLTSIGSSPGWEMGLTLMQNNAMLSLNGLNNLTSIDGLVFIEFNQVLISLIGLNNLVSINSDLEISNNNALDSLSGLDNLVSIEGALDIHYNPSLTSLAGLDNVNPGSISNLVIYGNDYLSTCDVESVCEYLIVLGGESQISNNAPGCNSAQEVKDSCGVWPGLKEFNLDDSFTVSPNPLQSTTLIKYNLNYKSPVTIKVFDLTGVEIITLVNELQQQGEQQVVFNTSDLQTGIYFCVLKTNNGIQTKRIIKL